MVLFAPGNAISGDFSHGDNPAQHNGASSVLLAGSGDNPWALPERRPQKGNGKLPSYITDPKYPTKEDVETKLDYGKKERNNSNTVEQRQQNRPMYGAPLGLPAVPPIYAPYSGAPYGYQPGYPAYPGVGAMPGLGAPYMGDSPGFGGNPLITPYGNIYGNTAPYQESQPSPQD
jgi:hypothetical protein